MELCTDQDISSSADTVKDIPNCTDAERRKWSTYNENPGKVYLGGISAET